MKLPMLRRRAYGTNENSRPQSEIKTKYGKLAKLVSEEWVYRQSRLRGGTGGVVVRSRRCRWCQWEWEKRSDPLSANRNDGLRVIRTCVPTVLTCVCPVMHVGSSLLHGKCLQRRLARPQCLSILMARSGGSIVAEFEVRSSRALEPFAKITICRPRHDTSSSYEAALFQKHASTLLTSAAKCLSSLDLPRTFCLPVGPNTPQIR